MKNLNIRFNTELNFQGSIEEFKKLTVNLVKMPIKIGHPAEGLMINTVPLPEDQIFPESEMIPAARLLRLNLIKKLKIEFKANIEFKGPVETFKKLVLALGKLPVTLHSPVGHISSALWPRPIPFPGGIPIIRLLSKNFIEDLIKGMPIIKIVDGIEGGVRNAHLHLKDRIVFLDRARFKNMVTKIASDLAGKMAVKGDYAETINAIKNLEM